MPEASLPLTALSEAQRAQALERFTIIRPALDKEVSQAQVARTHHLPPSTVQLWIKRYREKGLAGLTTRARSDKGKSRRLPAPKIGREARRPVIHPALTLRKITQPALPPTVLHREALLQQLSEAITGVSSESDKGGSAYKLILLHAPAGYGKTTLLADFTRQAMLPCCWYLLDRSDADKIIFLEYLLASIRARFPFFGSALDLSLSAAADQGAEDGFEGLVELFVEALARELPERFVLFLCNYHEVHENPQINTLVNRLLQGATPCVLVIESRVVPDLAFASLLARREMCVISRECFRLNSEEIAALASLQGLASLNQGEAEHLATVFDGWMAGILLGTRLGEVRHLAGKTSGGALLLREAPASSVDRQFLFAYVVTEVFKDHPDLYGFLKDACVLEEMTPSLCNALLGIADASARLHDLEYYGLFVSRSGVPPQETYLCHPVLRDLLAEELRRLDPERFALLHRRAAELLRVAQDYERAITHALSAKVEQTAVDLILEAAKPMLAQGHTETLERWIDALPAATLAHSPNLLQIRAHLYCLAEEWGRALLVLDEVSAQISAQTNGMEAVDLLPLQVEMALTRGKALYRTGAYRAAQDCYHWVLAAVPPAESALRVVATRSLGQCLLDQGDATTALSHLQQALRLCGPHTNAYETAGIHSALMRLYTGVGNLVLAEHHLTRAMACRELLQDVRGEVYDLLRMGLLKKHQGAFLEAEAAFTRALTQATTLHLVLTRTYALAYLGGFYQEQGLYERALEYLTEGLALARQRESQDRYLINRLLYHLALTYLYLGDAETATQLVSDIHLSPDEEGMLSADRAYHDLAAGTIFCFQQRYEEAIDSLTPSETAFTAMGFKEGQIQTWLRLAACYLAQGEESLALRFLEKVTPILMTNEAYQQMALRELHRLPAIEQAISTRRDCSHLRTFLHLGTESQPPECFIQPGELSTERQLITMGSAHPSQFRILALGEPVVFHEERPVRRWRMARALEIFFFLLDAARPVSKEQIMTALWPEADKESANTFYTTIYYVRKALGEECIISHQKTYTLNPTLLSRSQVSYDVAAFEDEHAIAKQALAQEDDKAARGALEAMIDLYRGDYVQPFYSDWCIFRRERLRTTYLDARHHLAQLAWRSEAFEESASHFQHILVVDPSREEAHYGLMRCYLRQGKRTLALRQYQRCRETLQQELNVEPGPALQKLYQHLKGTSAR